MLVKDVGKDKRFRRRRADDHTFLQRRVRCEILESRCEKNLTVKLAGSEKSAASLKELPVADVIAT